MILAVLGVLTGLGALAFGGYALARARAIDADTRVLAQRAVASAQAGGIDPFAVRDMAVLHYDALEEMSGARSFSLALLNGDGDGVVVTSINGRTESRTYAKAVVRGESETLLSPEEYRVVRAARLGDGVRSTTPVTRVAGPVVPEDAEAPVTVVSEPEPEPGASDGADTEPGAGGPKVVEPVGPGDASPASRRRTAIRKAPEPRREP
ncbi:DUF4446 family protein [Nocardiopsis lambiniae]|uniref:DUF4446 family protein n=1 Tax=Nocardiopsis lambiniae TaxID=3075539 RepID=A0ABU2MEE9_9ACTN|nr:DUF4446 family protein [Nocardiopsis sp. DSM 44743]MDT0330997.1 DUF4446 family protein [Nocardiopsis sp. DSM 44743]